MQFKLDTTNSLVTPTGRAGLCPPFLHPEELNRNLPQVLAEVIRRVSE